MTSADPTALPLLGAERPAGMVDRHFEVLGMALAWQGADEALTAAAAQVLDSRAEGTPSGLDMCIVALWAEAADAGASRGGLGAFTAAADGRAYREAAGLLAVLTPSGSCSLADLDAGRVTIFVSRQADLAAEAEALFAAPVWRYAAHQGMVASHAATVVAPSGRGILLRAPGGGGKSTLALAAWRQGMGLLSEEVTWLDLRASGAEATLRGRPDHLHVAPAVLAATKAGTPAAAVGVAGGNPAAPDKVRVAIAADERLRGSAPAGAVVFLARGETAETGRWRRTTALEALERWRHTAVPGEASQHRDALAAALRTLLGRGAYVLGGDSPDRMAARLLEIDDDEGANR